MFILTMPSTAAVCLLLLWPVASGTAADDLTVVTAHPGDDVILPCQANDSSIIAVEWTRPDLEPPKYVLYCSDGHCDPTHQHPSFKDRVDLVDRDLKDGDVSLILKNVSSNDNGTYECRVKLDSSRRKKRAIIDSEPIRTIRLQVQNSSPVGRYHGLAAGVPVGLILVAVAVVGVLMYKRHKNKRSGQPAADDDDDEALGDTLV
ncbi:coxsackievirus and adenovirus receptor homolog [Perca fluviatilis]|uniref:coxsackievirus and adenovirus receptor homolog n=1 Tax=Perca fluviatilis TaxID=8168 RepID=UPI00196348AB|nr:coxsackievirus and adenovirus receptor homolog [Perca fluviatilis]